MSNYPKGSKMRKVFLNTALEIFLEKGYEKTTIQDIIDKINVSKGSFYHYFQSKEDIIIQIAEEYVKDFSPIFNEIPFVDSLTPLEKLNMMINLVQMQKSKNDNHRKSIKDALKNEDNYKLKQKIFEAIKIEATEAFTKVINEGKEKGQFKVESTEEFVDFFYYAIHHLNVSIDDLVMKLSRKSISFSNFALRLEEKLSFYESLFAHSLNLDKGSLKLKESYLKRFLAS